jgi:hypothetical protein
VAEGWWEICALFGGGAAASRRLRRERKHTTATRRCGFWTPPTRDDQIRSGAGFTGAGDPHKYSGGADLFSLRRGLLAEVAATERRGAAFVKGRSESLLSPQVPCCACFRSCSFSPTEALFVRLCPQNPRRFICGRGFLTCVRTRFALFATFARFIVFLFSPKDVLSSIPLREAQVSLFSACITIASCWSRRRAALLLALVEGIQETLTRSHSNALQRNYSPPPSARARLDALLLMFRLRALVV